MDKRRLLYISLVTSLLISIAITPKPVFSAQKPLLYVDPPLIENLAPGEEFMISVKIANITDLFAFDVKLRWNPDLLEYINHTVTVPVEDYPEGVLYEPIQPIKNKVNSTAGTYWSAYSSSGFVPTFNGSGTMFRMFFQVKDEGRCALEIYSSDLADRLVPPTHMDHDVQHGHFINFEPPPAKISVNPDKIIKQSLVPCTNFTITIDLKDAYDLYSFEFSLNYNTTLLDVSNVTITEEFPQSNAEILETEGKINVSGSQGDYTGSLTLAWITFHVSDIGESLLDLNSVNLTDVWGEAITCEEPLDGYFNNMVITKLYVNPTEIFIANPLPGQSETSIDIRMQNFYDFYSYQYNLTYEPEILTCLGAIIEPPNTDPNFQVEQTITDEGGFVWINVTYFPPAEPVDIFNETVTTIYFQIQEAGCSHLNLTDTKIQDYYDEPISHQVENGKVCAATVDVAIIDVQLSCQAVYGIGKPGETVNITVTALNEGNLTETFNVTTYYDVNLIGTQKVVDLNPNENATLTFIWDTTGFEPCNNYTIKAEASQLPYETDLEDNVYSDGWVVITMLGDVTEPYGKIDLYDVTVVAYAYGSERGDPNWYERADLATPYGVIDLFDMSIVCARYGTTCG